MYSTTLVFKNPHTCIIVQLAHMYVCIITNTPTHMHIHAPRVMHIALYQATGVHI